MTRGPEQGRPPQQILAEARVLADQGCKEITLIGQTVNSYKFMSGGQTTRLSDLLYALHDIDGIQRLKFVTNYPKDMTDDLLQAVRDLPKCSPYLHVPAQSGSNDVLARMKRGYTVEDYREMYGRLRETIPDAAVTSDFIVGFCGETEASFQKTMDLVREARFKNSFIFKYSPRPGTKADDLYPDDVPEEVKKRRNNDLLAVQNANSLDDHKARVGETATVLVEGPSKVGERQPAGGARQLSGRTMTDHIVVFDGHDRLIGRTLRVHVREASPFTLYGVADTGEVAGGELMPRAEPAGPRRTLPLV
jgi:tRNA-2-methylthio-N6-dimethylallyladenosine synthase